MLSSRRGATAVPQLLSWAQAITKRADPEIDVQVEFEDDSHTFILRLAKDARVLIFRLSQSQVYSDGREIECQRTLLRKIKDLWNLL